MISKTVILALSVLSIVSTIDCKQLPKYIKKCSIKDAAEFEKCAVASGNAAIAHFLAGDKEHKIPSLTPLELPLLELNAGNLNLTLRNAKMFGMEKQKINYIKYDKALKRINFNIFFDLMTLASDYKVVGKILILPISGEGKGLLDFKDADLKFSFDLKEMKNKDGKLVIKVDNPQLEPTFGGLHFKLENLFNGDKTLGDEMNRFLNENWKEVLSEFQELVNGPMKSVMVRIASGFLNNLVLEDIFGDVEK